MAAAVWHMHRPQQFVHLGKKPVPEGGRRRGAVCTGRETGARIGGGDMRKKAGCLAALGVGLAVSLVGAEPPKSEPASGGNWLGGLFGEKPKPPEKKKAEPVAPTITVADRAAELQRLQKAYWR